MGMRSPYKAYSCQFGSYDPQVIMAISPAKAKYSFWMDYLSYWGKFADLMNCIQVSRTKPDDKILDGINRYYGTSFRIGQFVKALGCEGWILGQKGPYVKVGHGDAGKIYHPKDVKTL
jgi:hypothetical protein